MINKEKEAPNHQIYIKRRNWTAHNSERRASCRTWPLSFIMAFMVAERPLPLM